MTDLSHLSEEEKEQLACICQIILAAKDKDWKTCRRIALSCGRLDMYQANRAVATLQNLQRPLRPNRPIPKRHRR